MLNLFTFRATDPKVMKAHPGPEADDFEAVPSDANMFVLCNAILNMNTFLACGRHGLYRDRLRHVLHSYQNSAGSRVAWESTGTRLRNTRSTSRRPRSRFPTNQE